MSFACGVVSVSLCSTLMYLVITSNEAMCQPSSHGRPAMGACSNQVVCHGILSHQKKHHYKNSFGIEQIETNLRL